MVVYIQINVAKQRKNPVNLYILRRFLGVQLNCTQNQITLAYVHVRNFSEKQTKEQNHIEELSPEILVHPFSPCPQNS